MKLDSRKLKVLACIVETYIKTGEPVGSKLLASLLEYQVSPATIRNDMASLFEMGLLEQPHTSAGRIPSHTGYRVYIDKLMNCKPLSQEEKDEIDALFNVKNPDPEKLLEDAAQTLAEYTNCATISSTITPKSVCIRRVDLVIVGIRTVLIVVIATNGVIKNMTVRVDFNITPEICDFFVKFANDRFVGKSVNSINTSFVSSMVVSLGDYSTIFTPLIAGIYELCKQIDEGLFFLGGETNILSYKEFSPIAYDMLNLMKNKDEMLSLFADSEQGKVIIGKENSHMQLAGSSVLVTKYKIGNNNIGAIGIIGPVRLDYAKLIPHIEYFAQTLGKLLTETLEEPYNTERS
ncbi:MAG TPA: heat-inducible transcription repressor HrcA [Ruminococcaceae bacterium]|nr:heat-inducible transcription repressor HrcA [Oscillospiraceae bacterium]